MDTFPLEAHPPYYSGPNFSRPADSQFLSVYDMGKYEGSLEVPTPVENTLSFRGQDYCEPETYGSIGCVVTAG